MADLQAVVQGSLTIKPTPSSPPKRAATTGCNFGISLRDGSGAGETEISQTCREISGAGYQSLASGQFAHVLYIRSINRTPIDVRITREVSAQETISQVHGMVLLEFSADDRLTALEVQGDGAQIEWALFGSNS